MTIELDEKDFLLAQEIAKEAHQGQVDKCGEPYYRHPRRVACYVEDLIWGVVDNKTPYEIVAVLHDTIEDTDIDPTEIERRFGKDILDAVYSVTRKKGESYSDFIKRCNLNPIGRMVKLADLEDNLDIIRLARKDSYEWTEKDAHRIEKYFKAYQYLAFGKGEPIN